MAIKINPTTNIPTENSTDFQWIGWHKALKQRYGLKTANTLFLEAWRERNNSSANTTNLRNYLTKNKINVNKSAWDYVADFGDDTGDIISGFFGFGKFITYSLVIILLVGIAMVVLWIGRNPAQAVSTGVALRTGGAMGKLK